MKITYEGADYDFDFNDITVKQAIKIEKHTGMTLSEWGAATEKGASAVALQAVGWLVLHGGRDIPIEDCDFKMAALGDAIMKAAAAQEAAGALAEAAGPTLPQPPPNGSGEQPIQALSLPSSPTG